LSYKTLLFDLSDNVATISFNRPDRLNALSIELLRELAAALEAVARSDARALLVTGEGRAFCAGADLLDIQAQLPIDLKHLLNTYYLPPIQALAELKIPVVTAINGLAAGAGLSFALSADIVLAAQSSYLMLAFANIGLVPDAGATWFVAKAVGRMKALEMALTGDKVPAQKAEQIGLITRAVDDEALMDEARSLARKLAERPTVALGLIRQQFRTGLTGTLEETFAAEAENQGVAGATADFAEAVAAFGEKRPPIFKGK
jgi:2-(1,2-epoxy-1,2-dihydrophenyl)acetyl-CoA isomerase